MESRSLGNESLSLRAGLGSHLGPGPSHEEVSRSHSCRWGPHLCTALNSFLGLSYWTQICLLHVTETEAHVQDIPGLECKILRCQFFQGQWPRTFIYPHHPSLPHSACYFQFPYSLDSWQKISEISGRVRKRRQIPFREERGRVMSQTQGPGLPFLAGSGSSGHPYPV